MFYTAPTGGPRPLALIQGTLGAFAIMAGLLFLMGRGGQRVLRTVGSGVPREGMLQVSAGVEGAAPPDAKVVVQPSRPRPTSGRLFEYVRALPFLRAIDTDGDLAISDAEMARAPAALRKLDRDRDGSLSPEACGFEVPAGEHDARFLRISRIWYMRVHPVLAALDGDGNGTVSPVELATATASLRALDWDHDGQLTAGELLPDPVVTALAVYMVRWDKDEDGRISRQEAAAMPKELRDVLPAIPSGESGVGETALRNELRRRAISHGDGGEAQLELAGRDIPPKIYDKKR